MIFCIPKFLEVMAPWLPLPMKKSGDHGGDSSSPCARGGAFQLVMGGSPKKFAGLVFVNGKKSPRSKWDDDDLGVPRHDETEKKKHMVFSVFMVNSLLDGGELPTNRLGGLVDPGFLNGIFVGSTTVINKGL